jgi:hypothetical protein
MSKAVERIESRSHGSLPVCAPQAFANFASGSVFAGQFRTDGFTARQAID